jgi:hypothetical protein
MNLGKGTVWSGVSNSSDWLISGWGTSLDQSATNPYLYVNDTAEDSSEAEWSGGDVFAISSNGTSWFLSGMGSGVLKSYSSVETNHLSAGLFDGKKFTDLSSELPDQMDGILYANAFNGSEWLVGGGYLDTGVLFSFNGTSFQDLTGKIASAIPSFQSVQSIGWNGRYWLVGGIGFLALYDGSTFTDLTSNLTHVLSPELNSIETFTVNSIAWNGTIWLLGGGQPVAFSSSWSSAWIASYDKSSFLDLTSILPHYAIGINADSSILSIAASSSRHSWIIGGYASNNAMLLELNLNINDYSNLTGDMSYITWVGTS